MESIRRLMFRKENPPWEKIKDMWDFFVYSLKTSEDWNPWKEWCKSWEMYEISHSKPPKSGKKKEAVWRELYDLAKVTAKTLDEGIAMRKQLKNQNAKLQQLVTSAYQQMENFQQEVTSEHQQVKNLQRDVTSAYQKLKNQNAELEKFQEENLLLKAKCEALQNKLYNEEVMRVRDEYHHKLDQENEVNKRQTAEKENKRLRANLQETLTQLEELEDEMSAIKGQVVPVNEEQKDSVKYIVNLSKNYIIVNYPAPNQLAIEEEESWFYRARRAGPGCPSRYKIWKRLEEYEDPRLTVDHAPYWQLVVRLSRYEDLETREPR